MVKKYEDIYIPVDIDDAIGNSFNELASGTRYKLNFKTGYSPDFVKPKTELTGFEKPKEIKVAPLKPVEQDDLPSNLDSIAMSNTLKEAHKNASSVVEPCTA